MILKYQKNSKKSRNTKNWYLFNFLYLIKQLFLSFWNFFLLVICILFYLDISINFNYCYIHELYCVIDFDMVGGFLNDILRSFNRYSNDPWMMSYYRFWWICWGSSNDIKRSFDHYGNNQTWAQSKLIMAEENSDQVCKIVKCQYPKSHQ